MSRNSGTCIVRNCARHAFTRSMCSAHYFRWLRHGDVQAAVPVRGPRYRDNLPRGYWSDTSLAEDVQFFGAVIVCDKCGDQLGPVWTAASAVMAIHGHELRAHNFPGYSAWEDKR